MMKVWYISEECHGFIGLASCWDKVCDFLIETKWLEANSMDEHGKTLYDYYGDHWPYYVRTYFKKQDFENYGFCLREVDVYD